MFKKYKMWSKKHQENGLGVLLQRYKDLYPDELEEDCCLCSTSISNGSRAMDCYKCSWTWLIENLISERRKKAIKDEICKLEAKSKGYALCDVYYQVVFKTKRHIDSARAKGDKAWIQHRKPLIRKCMREWIKANEEQQ